MCGGNSKEFINGSVIAMHSTCSDSPTAVLKCTAGMFDALLFKAHRVLLI